MSLSSGQFDDDEVMSEINVTPLVDVMLVLLIIFMITVPVLTHTVNVELPQVSTALQPIKPDTITLAVGAGGEIYWDRDRVDVAGLEQRLGQAAQQQPQPEFQLRGDRAVAYEHVVRVMAAVQRAGLTKLGFVTEPTAAR
jgi:biopolymer transport protein ExbD